MLQKRVEYDYDLFDRRIGKRVDSDGDETFDRAERYVYDGEDVVLTFDGSGSLAHRFLHGPGYDQPLADEVFASGEIFWLLDDNQGTVRDMAVYDDVSRRRRACRTIGISGHRSTKNSMPKPRSTVTRIS